MKKHTSFLRLLAFEWRKNFLSPWLLIFTVILLLLNGWKLTEEYSKKTAEFAVIDHIYEDFYAQWSGTITAEKIESLMAVYGPLEDFGSLSYVPGSGTYADTEAGDHRFIFSNFYNEMKYDYLYVNQSIELAQKAKDLAAFYESIGSAYKAAESEAYAKTFQGRSISQFADTRYLEVWLNHDYSSMLVLLLSLFGLCTVFVTERETEMYILQRTAKLGGGSTVAAKLTASACFILIVCLIFYGQDFLVLQLLSEHWEALSSPVYAIRYLEMTPLRLTLGQFILWVLGFKTLGILGCGCLILLASCVFKRVLTAFAAGFGGIMMLVVLQEFSRTRIGLKWFNPMELVMVREIVTDTVFVNVFGFPIHLYCFVMAGICLTTAVMVLGILRLNPGRMERRCGR